MERTNLIVGTLNLSGSIAMTVSRSLSENTIVGTSRLMNDVQGLRISMSRHRLVALSIIMVSPQHVSRLIRLVLNGSHRIRLLAELEAHDGFSDSQRR